MKVNISKQHYKLGESTCKKVKQISYSGVNIKINGENSMTYCYRKESPYWTIKYKSQTLLVMNNFKISYIAVAILIFGCNSQPEENVDSKHPIEDNVLVLNTDQIKQLNVKSSKIKVDTISTVLSIGGKISTPTQGQMELGYPISAKINSIFVEPGSSISKGQKLLTLSDISLVELQQDYLMQKAELENLQQQFNRIAAIKSQNATSEKSFQEAQTALNKSKITISGMEQKMNLLMVPFPKNPQDIQQQITLIAPISGKVNQLFIKSGQYCQAGQSLLSIVDNSQLQCELISFQNVPLNLSVGMPVTLKDNNGQSAQATVQRFGNSLEETDHGLHIWLSLINAPSNWIPGVTVNAYLTVESLPGIPVPSRGIAYWESKPQIFIAQGDGKYTMKEVNIIKEERGIAYIQSTAFTDNEIVTQSAHYLLMALKNTGE